MNILLTHGYFIQDDPVEYEIMKPYPPVGLLFLSAWLKKSGIPHELLDVTFLSMDALKDRLANGGTSLVGIYVTLMTRSNVLKMIDMIKAQSGINDVKIVLGGPDTRWHAEGYLLRGADVIIPGEGEETLEETVRALLGDKGNQLDDIKGIYYLNKDGVAVFTGERKFLDPQVIPLPSYDHVDVTRYLRTWKERHGFSSMAINSMRGCPYSCNWCSKSVYGNSYRRRSPKDVVEEMVMLRDTFQPDQVWFTDDVFTISKSWLKEFATEVDKHNLTMPYECISRSDCMDEEVIHLLKTTGCRKVWIGAESGSQKVIDLMNRKIHLEWTTQMFLKLRSEEIKAGTFIMLGYQGEKKRDIFLTAKFLKRILPDDLTIGVAYPIKGTKFFGQMEPYFDNPYDWQAGNERQIKFKKPYSGRFYRFATRYLYNSVAAGKEKKAMKKYIFLFKALVSGCYIFLFR